MPLLACVGEPALQKPDLEIHVRKIGDPSLGESPQYNTVADHETRIDLSAEPQELVLRIATQHQANIPVAQSSCDVRDACAKNL